MTALLIRIRWHLSTFLWRFLVPIQPRRDLEKLGSDYGGWIVPGSLINADWVCYCGGVGEDLSFDLALIDRFGCTVHAFDPTPRAVAYVAAADPPSTFSFHPVGIWDRNETLRFYAPHNPAHVSHSAVNLQRTETYFEAPARGIVDLVEELSDGRVDLLKLDIEGAEHRVLEQLVTRDLRPTVLCVEFDQPASLRLMLRTARRLFTAGYRLVAIDVWNHTFVHDDPPEKGR